MPYGPKLAPLADMALCVNTFDKFGFWGSDLTNLSKTIDIFAPVSSNAIAVKFRIVTRYVAVFPCREILLMTIIVSGSSQSDVGIIKMQNLSNSYITSSLSLSSLIGSWLDG